MPGRRADRRQDGLDLALHLAIARLRPRGVGALERLQHGPHQVVTQIRRQHAPRRERRGGGRDDDPRDPELARDRHRVERPAPAVGDQRVVPRVEASLGGDAAHRQRHLHVGQPHDPGGRVVAREPEGQPEALLDGPRGSGVVQGHGPAKKAPGRDAPQHQVGVGDGGLGTAAAVADRARGRARALRAQGQRAAGVDPGDGAAARAHLGDVDDRDAERVAVHVILVGGLHEPARDDRALGGGPAHVEGDEPVRAERLREARAADRPRRGARLDRVHRLGRGGGDREGPAVRLGDQELAAETATGQPPLEVAEVAVHDRPDVGVHHRGAGALVLAPLLGDPVGDRHRRPREHLRDQLGGAPLVLRVAEREHEAHRDRLDPVLAQPAGRVADGRLVQRDQHLAPRGHALAHLEAAAARHQGGGPAVEHIVHAQEVAPADLEHVPEPLGGDEAGQHALALEQGVDPDGGPVDDEAAVGQARPRLVHAPENPLEQVVRGGEGLGVHQGAGRLVQRDQVREGATDVDADPECHGCAKYTGAWPRVASRALSIPRGVVLP